MTPTAFLDRDGTINVKPAEGHYVTRPEDLVLLPRAAEAIARLNQAGWRTIVVTNQRGVALGRMSEEDLAAVHRRLEDELTASGAHVDGIYACPHAEGKCHCRKPATGLFERALADHPEIQLADAVVVGDSWRDMEAAAALGCRRLLIGKSQETSESLSRDVVSSLWDAVDRLLERGA